MNINRNLIALPVLLALICLPQITLAQPPIEIDPPNMEVRRGEIGEFVLVLTNISDEARRIMLDFDVVLEPDDDRTPPVITIDPVEADLNAGDVVDIMITVDASDSDVGDFDLEVHILSNDPNDPDMFWQGVVTVNPRPPEIEFEWEDDLFDNDLNLNDAFPDVFFGFPYQIEGVVRNLGDDVLSVEASTSNEVFTVEPGNFDVESGQSVEITVSFEAPEAGHYEGHLILNSNDPDNGELVISMVVDATGPPELGPIDDIEEFLITGEIYQETINLENRGNGHLRFMVEIAIIDEPQQDSPHRALRSTDGRIPMKRDDPGDQVGQFDGNNAAEQYCSCIGWDWDNERMWITNYTAQNAVAWSHDADYGNFNEEIRIDPGQCMDGAWAKGLLYLPTWASQTINRYDENGRNIGAIDLGYRVYGMAADVENDWLFIMNGDDNQAIYVYNLNNDGSLGDRIGAIRNFQQFLWGRPCYNLEWVPKHPDGQLWVTDGNSGYVGQIQVDTEEWVCTERVQYFRVFPNADQPYCAVAHDGTNLWVGGFSPNSIRIYDDGIAEPHWIIVEPMEGEIGQDESLELTVTLDATGLYGGDYIAEIHILNNDPRNPDMVVNVEMTVEYPIGVWFEWPEEHGFPDEMSFYDTFIGEADTVRAIATNWGFDEWVIEEITVDNDVFSVTPNQDIVLEPGEEIELLFIFTPENAEQYDGSFTLFTNDPDEEEFNLHVTGVGVEPPRIEVSHRSIFFEGSRIQDDPIVEVFSISNNAGEGAGSLSFFITKEAQQERRDIEVRKLRTTGNSTGRIFRDDPPRSRFLLVEESNPWNYDLSRDFDNINADYDRIDTPNNLGDIDLEDYDIVYFANFQSDGWNAEYNNHLNQIEEFVDRGGTYYMCTGTNNWGVAPVHPGGLVRTQGQNQNIGFTVQRQQDNWLMEYLDWDPGHRCNGNAFNHAFYQENSLRDIENSRDYQVIFETQNELPIMAVYSYGSGSCVVSGCTDGYLQANYNRDGEWGQAMAQGALLYYLDQLEEFRWLDVEPASGIITSGESQEISVTFAPALFDYDYYDGHYYLVLKIRSNDPESPDVEVEVSIRFLDPPHPPLWEETGSNHSILLTDVTYEGRGVPDGWEIGVFTPGGVICGGVIWRNEQDGIAVWGADDDHENYFHDGELMSFRGWDPWEDQEYAMRANLEEGDLHWENNGFTVLSLAAVIGGGRQYAIRPGWSLLSINVVPADEGLYIRQEGPDVVRMLAQLRLENGAHHVELFKDQNGQFYRPTANFNNIPFWSLQQGYQIKVDQEVDIEWMGAAIDPQADIPLRQGWNIAPYYPDYDLSASRASDFYALRSIADHVLIAKDDDGNFMIPDRGFSNMSPWHEGKAYQIKVDQAVTLNYPEQQQRMHGDAVYVAEDKATHFQAVSRTGRNMSLLIEDCNLPSVDCVDSVELGVCTPSGLCVGAVSIQSSIHNLQSAIGLAVWGDDPTTPEIDGAVEGEALTFKLWDGAGEVSILPIWSEGTGVYKTDALAICELDRGLVPNSEILTAFPNPFNSSTQISFSTLEFGSTRLLLFDSGGRELMTIVDGELQAGEHSVKLNGQDLAAGIYFLRLEATGMILTRKLALLK